MFSIKNLTTAMILLLGLAISAFAGEAQTEKKQEKAIELKEQTHCPVMGGKINKEVYTDIQGQRVYHCCPACSDKLKADPDKYFKKAAAEGVLYENIQTACPVSGEKLEDKSVYTDYEGRRIAFCCKQCRAKFNEDPQKYLNNLDEQKDSEKKSEMKMDHSSQDHSKHNH